MFKKFAHIFFLASFLLTACSTGTAQLADPSVNAVQTQLQVSPQPLSPTTAPSVSPNLSICTYVSGAKDTPNPTDVAASIFRPVGDSDWVLGSADASITIIAYLDFQCASCASVFAALSYLLEAYPEDLRIVLRFFPVSQDDKAMISAQAAEAAGLQGKYWEMANLLYSQQATWSGMTASEFDAWVKGEALTLDLDVDLFTGDMVGEETITKLTGLSEEGTNTGIPYIPFLIIDGEIWQGPQDVNNLKSVVSLLLLGKKQVIGCPPTVIDVNKTYLAHITTEKGEIVIQLFADEAPLAVNSFVFLARQGWFDGITFHQVLPGEIAQTGDPSGTGYGGPGYAFRNEINADLNFDRAGMVGMSNAGSDSNGSQFFITLASQPDLDGKYTVFGQVVQGLDVVQELTPRDPSQGSLLPDGDKIISVTIEEK